MQIDRKRLMAVLVTVKLGISNMEENSECLLFKEDNIYSFNDNIYCHAEFSTGITGLLDYTALYNILKSIANDTVDIENTPKGIEIKYGVNKKATLLKKKVDDSDLPSIDYELEWKELPENFMRLAKSCAMITAKGYTMPKLACVCMHKNILKSTDNFQAIRVDIGADIFEKETLINAAVLSPITSCKLTEIAISNSWIHFRNKDVIVSGRLVNDSYVDLNFLFDDTGAVEIVLPKDMVEGLQRADIFGGKSTLDNKASISIEDNELTIIVKSEFGSLDEKYDIKYSGSKVSFSVIPSLLKSLIRNDIKLYLTGSRLFLVNETTMHVITLEVN